LTLGISRGEATISYRGRFEIGDIGTGGAGPAVEGVNVTYVDVNEGRRMRP